MKITKFIVPSKEQWNSWSLQTRLGVIVAYITIITALISMVKFLIPEEDTGLVINSLTPVAITQSNQGCSSYRKAVRNREYKILLDSVKIDTLPKKKIQFTISGSNSKTVIIKRILLKVDKIEKCVKYIFPGANFGEINTEMGGSLIFVVHLNKNRKLYEIYNITQNSAPLHYNHYLKSDGLTIYLDSEPGFKYFVRIGFEWYNVFDQNNSELYYTPTSLVLFPIYQKYYEIKRNPHNNIYLYTNNILGINELLLKYYNEKIFVIYNGNKNDSKNQNLLDLYRGTNISIYYLDLSTSLNSFLILDDSKILIKEKYIDPDWKGVFGWEMFLIRPPFKTNFYNSVDSVRVYKKLFKNFQSKAEFLYILNYKSESFKFPNLVAHHPIKHGSLRFKNDEGNLLFYEERIGSSISLKISINNGYRHTSYSFYKTKDFRKKTKDGLNVRKGSKLYISNGQGEKYFIRIINYDINRKLIAISIKKILPNKSLNTEFATRGMK